MSNVIAIQPAVETYGSRSMTAVDMQAQINLMQDVMTNNMIDGVHYGIIPGTKVPSLYKPGAEKLMSIFRLAADPEVEDLSKNGEAHYRVKVKIYSSGGQLLGAGIGECSSQEEKYAWRRAVCDEEFEVTAIDRRREKFSKWQGKTEKIKQIRTNPADVANTVLKMAKKRGLVDGILTVTAASDLFSQDVEDLPPEYLEEHAPMHKPNRYATAIPDSPERTEEITNANGVAKKGMEALKTYWKELPAEKRELVKDKMEGLKEIATKADKEAQDGTAQ